MQLLLSRAGLVLNPGQVADLVLAWRQLAGLIAAIPHDRPLADDMALTFRLPSPVSGAAGPSRELLARPKAKAKARAKAKGKTAAKRRTPAKLSPRKRPHRGR
jgi:hypothetical protein